MVIPLAPNYVRALLCRHLRPLARLDRHHRERGADVGEVVLVVAVDERAREPAAARALVRLEPGDALDEGGGVGGDAGLRQEEDGETCAVAVADGRGLFVAVGAFPAAEA